MADRLANGVRVYPDGDVEIRTEVYSDDYGHDVYTRDFSFEEIRAIYIAAKMAHDTTRSEGN